MDSVVKALIFLVETLFSIYIILLILRFLLQWQRSSFRDAPSHFIWQVTHPPLKLLYRFVQPWRDIDIAALILMFVLTLVKVILTWLLLHDHLPNVFFLLLLTFINLLYLTLYFFSFSILIGAIASWVIPPDSYNPLTHFLYRINEPLLRPVRRLLMQSEFLRQAPLDISPLVVLLALQVMIILLS
jgi:YggT family protein